MSDNPKCELCGEPMPDGETMFKYHGHSGPCPKPPLPKAATPSHGMTAERLEEILARVTHYTGGNSANDLRAHIERLTQERDEADQEVEHFSRLAFVDLGANPPIAWKARAETAEARLAALAEPVGGAEIVAVLTKLELRRPSEPIGKQYYTLDEVVANMAEAAALIRRLASSPQDEKV